MNKELEKLVETVSFLSAKGWVPATSSNFSIKAEDDRFLVSVSGVDKSKMRINDFMVLNHSMEDVEQSGHKPSAESLIHLEIYDKTSARCVLHTHSVASTVLSMNSHDSDRIEFKGYELIKGLAGQTNHEDEVHFPILDNSQDMNKFRVGLSQLFSDRPRMPGFIIRGHGVYAWGDSVFTAKRQIETIEFLLECRLNELKIK